MDVRSAEKKMAFLREQVVWYNDDMEKQPEKTRDLSEIRIESERLVLVPISLNFDKDIFAEFDDEVTKYMPIGPNESIEATDDFIRGAVEQAEAGENLQLVVTDREGEFLGLTSVKHANTREPELGLWLKKDAQGQGFGSESTFALVEWVQDNLDFDYLRFRADSENSGSWKIAEKLIEKYSGEYVGEQIEALRDGDRMTKFYKIFSKNP